MKKRHIYLGALLGALILGSIVHSRPFYIFTTGDVLAYYLGLLLLLIPNVLFFIFVKDKVKSEIRYKGLYIGFSLGVCDIVVFGVIGLLDPSTVVYGLNSFLYYIITLLPTVVMVVYLVISIKNNESDLKDNIGLFVMVMSFTLFMLSPMKGFYLYNDSIVTFLGRFLKFEVLTSYIFEGKLIYLFSTIGFFASSYFKYRFLEDLS